MLACWKEHKGLLVCLTEAEKSRSGWKPPWLGKSRLANLSTFFAIASSDSDEEFWATADLVLWSFDFV